MEASERDAIHRLVVLFEEHIPFNTWLGMRVEVATRGHCRVKIPFRPELVGDPTRPALHGGVLSTLADTAGGLALFLKFGNIGARISTLDLRVDYYEPARLSDVYADAHVVRIGNRVGVSRIVVHHGDPERVVAEGKGVYTVRAPRGEETGAGG